MMRRFLLTTWFALLAAAAAAPFQSAAAAGPDDFIRNLGNQAIEVIRSGASPDQKSAYFHRALHQDFDLRSQRNGGQLAGLFANMGEERGNGSGSSMPAR
jgi:ABC-type transporter MlaC component